MPTILGANTADDSYEISNSVRYNDGDSPEISSTPSSASNRRTWTWSCWIKRGVISSFNVFGAGPSVDDRAHFDFNSNGSFQVEAKNGGTTQLKHEGGVNLRDVAAWYHLVWRLDTTQSTAGNRSRVYVNGEQITFSSTNVTPDQNAELEINNNSVHKIGVRSYTDSNFMDGYMAEAALIDGTSYGPDTFAETDSNGVWVPKEFKDDVTFGTNGFYMEFKQTGGSANSSGIGADTSGNDNHYNVGNLAAFDITTDTPTNVYMTMNPLTTNSRGDFREGNTQVQTNVQGSVPYGQVEFGTFAVNKGKWYYEAKIASVGSGGNLGLGFNERAEDGNYTNGHNNLGSAGNVVYHSGGNLLIGSSHNQATGVDSFTDDDIIGVALDLDNDKIYFTKNGNYQDDPTPNPASNNGRSIVSSYNNYWTPWISKDDTNHNGNIKFNFGNPAYTISSSESDDNGYGNFEYDVPAGYYALNSKNLAEFG